MGAINRLPKGLLSILDVQAQGVNPRELAEFVQPTIDLQDLYWQGRGPELATTLTVVVGPGVASTISVPAGEMWAVHQASIILTPGDALATTWFPAIYQVKNGTQIPLEAVPVGIVTGSVTNTGSVIFKPSRPWYVLGPADGIQATIERITGAVAVLGVAVAFRVIFNRITI